MQTIFITKGLPGSGKSTWAKEYVRLNPNTIRINRDDIRDMITPNFPHGNNNMEKLVTEIEDAGVFSSIRMGYDVIIDATNFWNVETRVKRLIYGLVDLNNIKFEYKIFDTDVEECIKRDSLRPKPVGEIVIRRMYDKWLKGLGFNN